MAWQVIPKTKYAFVEPATEEDRKLADHFWKVESIARFIQNDPMLSVRKVYTSFGADLADVMVRGNGVFICKPEAYHLLHPMIGPYVETFNLKLLDDPDTPSLVAVHVLDEIDCVDQTAQFLLCAQMVGFLNIGLWF